MNSSSVANGVAGLIMGVVITPLAWIAAALSSGAGHGDYFAAKLIYPVPLALMVISNGWLILPALALGLVQLPIYGALLGFWLANEQLKRIGILAGVHVVAMIICFVSGFY